MQSAKICADWLATLLLGDPGLHYVQSIADTDVQEPDKIAIVWEDVLTEAVAPPLRIHDLEFDVRLPTTCDLTHAQWEAAIQFALAQFTPANFANLKARFTVVGKQLDDWFLGDSDTDSDRDNHRHVQDVRLALIWL